MGDDDEESAEVNELGDRVSNLFGLEDDGEEESGKDENPSRMISKGISMYITKLTRFSAWQHRKTLQTRKDAEKNEGTD